jgi:hypothetical protein
MPKFWLNFTHRCPQSVLSFVVFLLCGELHGVHGFFAGW